ncbi:formylglycine-generating enzyme family protein [Nocardioides solisilvae]|uniref:formylglycine-generating enzyme family protein n=1 Tax=Nocardioides solisilvae TaxID=1542435 RepID=UPI000D7497F2|nr:formylglycine-generating enzyme family protein [Nocardioides solisilvae]
MSCCAGGGAPASGGAAVADAYRPSPGAAVRKGQVRIPGGTVAMGDTFGEGDPADGEQPVHAVALAPYWMDETAVTNQAFARFVRETGHVTEAEELGVSPVFHLAVRAHPRDVLHPVVGLPWWWAVRGADWRHPAGPLSSVDQLPHHPVVHVTWRDADAYCRWAGKRLPTEAEWEHAARGGLVGARFPWGDEPTERGAWRLNIFQGDFPLHNTAEDGHPTTAPVRSYRPNGHGLWNTVGNVWEWCADWFSPTEYADRALAADLPVADPRGPRSGEQRVMRGGSYLCHDSYCRRYRVAARSSSTPDSASANVGFRCANDDPIPAARPAPTKEPR